MTMLRLTTLPSFTSLFYTLLFFLYNDTAPPELHTLSLHDALPISLSPFGLDHGNALAVDGRYQNRTRTGRRWGCALDIEGDRKSTRLNSSHVSISYAVFCLKKKKKKYIHNIIIK